MKPKILFLVETDSMTGSGKCALELLEQYKKNKFNDIIVPFLKIKNYSNVFLETKTNHYKILKK